MPDRANWYAPPLKVFDNLYWLGTRQHSSWALQTSAGLIVIDTNFAWATEPEIIAGLTTLGLNPRDIKYVIISHAHGDHDQGAAELQKRYGAQVVMGTPDWEATLKRPADTPGGVPKRDIAVGAGGTKLTLGDTTIQIVATPGHSPGTLSYVFPVKDQGRTVMVAYSWGTLTGAFGSDGARWDQYIASQRAIARVAAEMEASIILSDHSEYDGAYTKARLLSAPRQPGESHPFIVGTDGVQRYFTVMAECATASKLRPGAHSAPARAVQRSLRWQWIRYSSLTTSFELFRKPLAFGADFIDELGIRGELLPTVTVKWLPTYPLTGHRIKSRTVVAICAG